MTNEVKLNGQALLDEAARLGIHVNAIQCQRVLAHAAHVARGGNLPRRAGKQGVSVGSLRKRIAAAQQ